MDPDTGEVTKTIPAKGSNGQPAVPPPPSGGSGAGSNRGHNKAAAHTVANKLPKVSYRTKVGTRKLIVAFTTAGGSTVRTQLRLRAYHGGRLVANHAATVRDHRASFQVKLGKRRSGAYRMVLSIDAGGKLGVLRRTIRVR
jgi:hypothetical protein